MSLSPADLRRLKDAFNTWAKNTPDSDEPVLRVPNGKGSYSAREIAQEIENETKFGKSLVNMIELSIKNGETLDGIIKDFTTPSKPPKP